MSYLAVQNPLMHGAARMSVFTLFSFLYVIERKQKERDLGQGHP